jgi:hypothetical protein
MHHLLHKLLNFEMKKTLQIKFSEENSQLKAQDLLSFNAFRYSSMSREQFEFIFKLTVSQDNAIFLISKKSAKFVTVEIFLGTEFALFAFNKANTTKIVKLFFCISRSVS